ncbi:hypothetical protein L1279_001750 [Planomicrobium sp. HSC-17F08]|nr:hypothetical protein [Planomicrobium sp. HSC-17F08]
MRHRHIHEKLLFILLVMLFATGMLVGCSRTGAENTNEQVIQKVLELQFSGPDEEFMDAMWNPEYKKVVDGKEENEVFDRFVQEAYGDYFTESELDTFVRAFGTQYPSTAHSNGYKLDLKNVSIEQTEQASNRYEFIAQVGYQKDGGKEETAKVEGAIFFSTKEEGKIGRFQYSKDESLMESLSR